MAERLIESSPGEQRRLWKELRPEPRTVQTRSKPPSNSTRKQYRRMKMRRTYDGSGAVVRSDDELQLIDHLRHKRRQLMFEHHLAATEEERSVYTHRVSTINSQLYELTDNPIYKSRT